MLLYQGEYALNKSENIVKLENGTLRVKLTSDNDFGNYLCQFLVSNSQHPSINHTILKLSPPEIVSLLPENNQTVVSNLTSSFLTVKKLIKSKEVITIHNYIIRRHFIIINNLVIYFSV